MLLSQYGYPLPRHAPADAWRDRPPNRATAGYSWSLLEDAADPTVIVPGALILAGEEGDPVDPVAVCRVVELEEINNHTVVRFEILPGHIEDDAVLVKRHNINVQRRTAA